MDRRHDAFPAGLEQLPPHSQTMNAFFDTLTSIALDAILIAASVVIPKKEGLVAIGADLGTAYKGNPRYLYEFLLEHEAYELDPVWITESKAALEELEASDKPVFHKRTMGGFLTLLRAEFLVIDFTPRDLLYWGEVAFGRFRFIQTAHGMPIKKGGQLALEEGRGRRPRGKLALLQPLFTELKSALVYNVLLANYELVVAQSEASRNDLAALYVSEHVEVLGAPRNDILFDLEQRSTITGALDLDGYRRVLLYCPTWRDERERIEPLTRENWEALECWLTQNNSVLLVKKHPLDKDLAIPRKLPHIRDLTGKVDDVQHLCLIADVLITDYSSIAFDYSLTDRPIIYYCYDYTTYLTECRGMIYDYFETLPGPFARDASELLELLETLEEWSNEEDYKAAYTAFTTRFNSFRDGESARRLADFIKTILQPRRRQRVAYLARLLRHLKRRVNEERLTPGDRTPPAPDHATKASASDEEDETSTSDEKHRRNHLRRSSS